MRNGGRILLAALNLYVRIQIRVATFDTRHSLANDKLDAQILIHLLQSSITVINV